MIDRQFRIRGISRWVLVLLRWSSWSCPDSVWVYLYDLLTVFAARFSYVVMGRRVYSLRFRVRLASSGPKA